MRYIGYDELEKGQNFPKMKDSLENKAYPQKVDIIRFLQSGHIEFAQLSRSKDVFSGEIIPFEVLVMSDGNYYWSNELVWYVDKYNLRLPEDFEQHILRNS